LKIRLCELLGLEVPISASRPTANTRSAPASMASKTWRLNHQRHLGAEDLLPAGCGSHTPRSAEVPEWSTPMPITITTQSLTRAF